MCWGENWMKAQFLMFTISNTRQQIKHTKSGKGIMIFLNNENISYFLFELLDELRRMQTFVRTILILPFWPQCSYSSSPASLPFTQDWVWRLNPPGWMLLNRSLPSTWPRHPHGSTCAHNHVPAVMSVTEEELSTVINSPPLKPKQCFFNPQNFVIKSQRPGDTKRDECTIFFR